MTPPAVVGVIGRDVPIEMIDAAGAVPRRLSGRTAEDTAFAVDVLGEGLDPAAAGILTTALRPPVPLAGIACSTDSDLSLRVFYALRELRARGHALPPVQLVDILHLPRPASLAYDRRQLAALNDALAEWTARPASPEALADAVDARRRVRAGLLRLAAERPRRGSAAFWAARRAVDDLPAADAVARVADVLRQPAADGPAGTRVILTGSADLGAGTAEALEAAGLRVVGDDLPDGETGLELEAVTADLDGLAERAQRDDATPPPGLRPRTRAPVTPARRRT